MLLVITACIVGSVAWMFAALGFAAGYQAAAIGAWLAPPVLLWLGEALTERRIARNVDDAFGMAALTGILAFGLLVIWWEQQPRLSLSSTDWAVALAFLAPAALAVVVGIERHGLRAAESMLPLLGGFVAPVGLLGVAWFALRACSGSSRAAPVLGLSVAVAAAPGVLWGLFETERRVARAVWQAKNPGPGARAHLLAVGGAAPGEDFRRAWARDADLRSAPLFGARLHGACLRRARLDGARLDRAFLDGVDARRASLAGADLQDASIVGADFGGADLTGADLRRADTHGDLPGALPSAFSVDRPKASFRGASLRGADLRDADLRDADLTGADLFEARLDGARLPEGCPTPPPGRSAGQGGPRHR